MELFSTGSFVLPHICLECIVPTLGELSSALMIDHLLLLY